MKQEDNRTKNKTTKTTQLCHSILRAGMLPVLIVLALTACDREGTVLSDSKKPAPISAANNPVGTYGLVSIDGSTVPCTLEHEGHRMTVRSGSFQINADGTCASKMTLAGRNAPMEVKATYKQEGCTLTMKWQGAGMTVGTLEKDVFTMTNEGMVFAFRK